MTQRPGDYTEDWNPDNLPDMLPDDYDFWINRARYGYDPNYMGGQQCVLIWEGESPDAPEVTRILWSCGSGGRFGAWTPAEGGTKVTHPRLKYFARNSWMGLLTVRVVSEAPNGLGLQRTMGRRGHPLDARVWEGLSFHMVREPGNFGPGIEAPPHPMPVVFLGERDTRPGASVVAADAGLVAQLTELAQQCEDLKSFQSRALPIALGNDALLAQVADGTDNGFWARVRKEM